jgi:general L-amino acid transport system substrate-binding protein
MNNRFRPALLAAACVLALAAAAPAFAGKTLDAVKQRGTVKCGVTNGVAGFSAPDTQGNWSGLDVDTCRAIAAANNLSPAQVIVCVSLLQTQL